MSTEDMLRDLGSIIIDRRDDVMIIQVLPEVIVEVHELDLRSWCQRRIRSRNSHIGRAIFYHGGGPGTNSTVVDMYGHVI